MSLSCGASGTNAGHGRSSKYIFKPNLGIDGSGHSDKCSEMSTQSVQDYVHKCDAALLCTVIMLSVYSDLSCQWDTLVSDEDG
jgi:hypothetical protein